MYIYGGDIAVDIDTGKVVFGSVPERQKLGFTFESLWSGKFAKRAKDAFPVFEINADLPINNRTVTLKFADILVEYDYLVHRVSFHTRGISARVFYTLDHVIGIEGMTAVFKDGNGTLLFYEKSYSGDSVFTFKSIGWVGDLFLLCIGAEKGSITFIYDNKGNLRTIFTRIDAIALNDAYIDKTLNAKLSMVL